MRSPPRGQILKNTGLGGIPVTNVDNACSGGATALHHAYRVVSIVMPALYAMRARRYLHERDATERDLALVSVKARRHGAANPRPSVRIRASVLHSGMVDFGHRDMLRPEISYHSAADAYEMAGISPADLDVVELRDAFSIAELVYYEALGLCAPGDSAKLIRTGATTYGGRTVVNPSGGLLSKGHPPLSGVRVLEPRPQPQQAQHRGRPQDTGRPAGSTRSCRGDVVIENFRPGVAARLGYPADRIARLREAGI
jgi:acetyl-CoA acetyltransferase